MIDDPDDQTDYHIAHHIVRVHQKHEDALAPTFTTAQLKRYIAYAKTLKPKVWFSYYSYTEELDSIPPFSTKLINNTTCS